MKLQLSTFTILFLVLNSLLIFCATSNVDSGEKSSADLTETNLDTQTGVSSTKNTKIAEKPPLAIDRIISEKSAENLKAIIAAPLTNDFSDDSDEQKTEYFQSPLIDNISIGRFGISSQLSDKIGPISSYPQ